jgi:transposase
VAARRDAGGALRKKLAEGKPHRVAFNAVANKLCHVVYACLRDRRRYERDPVPKLREPGSPPVHGSAP